MFPNEHLIEILHRATDAIQQAVLFSVVDSMVYGNWFYSVACTIFTSNWILFWYMSLYTPTAEEIKRKIKKEKEKEKEKEKVE